MYRLTLNIDKYLLVKKQMCLKVSLKKYYEYMSNLLFFDRL